MAAKLPLASRLSVRMRAPTAVATLHRRFAVALAIRAAPVLSPANLRCLGAPSQQRYARRGRAGAAPPAFVEEEPRDIASSQRSSGGKGDEPSPEEIELPEIPKEILDEWDADMQAQEYLGFFASEELRSKKLMSFRDVARLLESLGCDKEEFLTLFEGNNDEDDEHGKGSKGGKGEGMKGGKGGKGGKGDDMFGPGASTGRFDDFGALKGGIYGGMGDDMHGGGRGGKSGKGGKGKGYEDDSDDELSFGGKGSSPKGGKGMKGAGNFGDFEDLRFGGKGSKSGKGGKGKSGKGYDFDGFGGGGGFGGKGGKKGGGKQFY